MLLYSKIIIFSLFSIVFSLTSKGQSSYLFCNDIPENDSVEIFTFYGAIYVKKGVLTNEKSHFNMPDGYIGFVRINYKTYYADIIYENKNLEFQINTNEKDKEITAHSVSNIKLRSLKEIYLTWSEKINTATDKKTKEELLKRRNHFTDSILSIDSLDFFSLSTRLAIKPLSGLTSYQIIDALPLDKPILIHCSIIPTYLLGSMRAIKNGDEMELKKLLTYLFQKKSDPEVNNLILSFLIEFFTSTHSDSILNFISANFLDNNYCNSTLSLDATKKLRQIELYRIGNKLPDSEINGKSLQRILKKYKKKDIAFIIWSMECPHCHEMLKRIESNKDNSIYYIGVELSDLKEGLMFNSVFDLSIKDNDGWKGKLVNDWMIDRTPMVFKIKSDLTILELPEP